MFGLMKTKRHKPSILNRKSNKETNFYCGLCKTMGSIYGQASRLSLNYDAAFLVELLTALSNEVPEKWDKKLHNKNCLSFPSQKNIPEILAFGASVNVLLAGIKIKDNKLDSNSLIWKGLDGLFASKYKKALSNLEKFGLNADLINENLIQNNEREKEQGQSVEYYSEISSMLTGEIFALGANVINQPELKNGLCKFGEKFGKLIYLLDAFEDYEQDLKQERFNAISAALSISDKTLPSKHRKENIEIIMELGNELIVLLNKLPLSEKLLQKFKISLNANLSQKLEQKEIKHYKLSLQKRLKLSSKLLKLSRNKKFIGNRPINAHWKIAGLAILALMMPGQLHAAPELLGTFSYEQLELVNDILKEFGLVCDCCDQCCSSCDGCCDSCNDCCDDCGGCCDGCDGCCDNCCDDCCEDCGKTVGRFLIILVIVFVLFIGGLVWLIIWLVRRSGRSDKNLQNKQNINLSKVPKYLLDENMKILINASSVKYLNDLIIAQKDDVSKRYTNEIVSFLHSVEPNIEQLKLLCYHYKKETGFNLIDELKSLTRIEVIARRYLSIFIRQNAVGAQSPFMEQEWWKNAILEMFKG